MPELRLGYKAPDFIGETTEGRKTLQDYKGKNLVIYFYVKDQTPGCTMQSCSLRDGIDKITSQNAEVLGVSVDDLESHHQFKAKHNLNFPLFVDTDFSMSRAFGAFNEERKMSKRMTFVVDRNGIIQHIFPKVDVSAHADEVLRVLKTLQ